MVFAWPRPRQADYESACSQSTVCARRGSGYQCWAHSRRATTRPRNRSTPCWSTTVCASASRPCTARLTWLGGARHRRHPLMHHRGEACYRLCGEGHHHHLVCSGCHRVVELGDCELDPWLTDLTAEHGFTLRGRTRSRSPASARLARRSAPPHSPGLRPSGEGHPRKRLVSSLLRVPRAVEMMRQLKRVSTSGSSPSACSLRPRPPRGPLIGVHQVVATSWPAAFAFDPGGRIFYGNRFTGEIRIFNPATGGDTLC